MKKSTFIVSLILLGGIVLAFFAFREPGITLASNERACSEPSFAAAAIQPNVLIVLDNSESMGDLAYDNTSSDYCYDYSYQSDHDYYGIYEKDKWYQYDNVTNKEWFEEVGDSAADCSLPSGSVIKGDDDCGGAACDFRVGIVNDTSASACFKGNFLNWLTMSKMDIEKKVLTGGKYDNSTTGKEVIIGESRGCQGRRYLKEVKDSGIVFGVRSSDPRSGEYGYVARSNTTLIEIFQAASADWSSTMEACQQAVSLFGSTDTDGSKGGFGQAQNLIKECLGFKPGPGNNPNKEWDGTSGHQYGFAAYLHSVHTCWHLNPTHSTGRPTPTPGDGQSIQSICESRYQKLLTDFNNDWLAVWTHLADPTNPSFICSRYPYPTKTTDPSAVAPEDRIGMGWCYIGDSGLGCGLITDETACNDKTGCSWSGTVDCSGASQTSCTATPGCMWQPDVDCSGYNNGSACDAVDGCSWSGTECSSLTFKATCESNGCSWTDAICGSYDQANCPSDLGCTWDENINCSDYTKQKGCEAQSPYCTWSGGVCVSTAVNGSCVAVSGRDPGSCNGTSTNGVCVADNGTCVSDGTATGSCVGDCGSICNSDGDPACSKTEQSSCDATSGCEYSNSSKTCVAVDSTALKDPWGDPYDVYGTSSNHYAIPEWNPSHLNNPADTCAGQTLINFCTEGSTSSVTDPSEDYSFLPDATDPSEYAYIPGNLVEAGVLSNLTPDGKTPLATMKNRKRQPDVPTGVLQGVKSKVRMGLMAMNDYGSAYEIDNGTPYSYTVEDNDGGSIRSFIKPDNEDIVTALNAVTPSTWTPIGESFYEVTRYLRELASAYNTDNASLYTNLSADQMPIEYWCQRSYVLFMSDGSSTMDKKLPLNDGSTGLTDDFTVDSILDELGISTASLAYNGTHYATAVAEWAHTNDIRDDFQDNQTVTFYTVFALGTDLGNQALKDIARYGGLYISDNSDDDTYFRAEDGATLEAAITKILTDIAATGSAAAVATVSQEMREGDMVVRGAFEKGKNSTGTTCWKGRLEVYWPYDMSCSAYSDTTTPKCWDALGCTWDNATSACTGTYTMYSFQEEDASPFCDGDHCWEAGTILNQRIVSDNATTDVDRCIFTMLNDNMTFFGGSSADWENIDVLCPDGLADSLSIDENAIKTALENNILDFNDNGTDSVDTEVLMKWVKGNTYYDGTKAHDRDDWILGDIIYSTPVVVGQPSLSSVPPVVSRENCSLDCMDNNTLTPDCVRDCFLAYRDYYHHNRDKMIYVGANDGMLHAFVLAEWSTDNESWVFDAGTDVDGDGDKVGQELWAYIPSSVLSDLKKLAQTGDCHYFTVDLTPEVWDVYIDHDGDGIRQWRTVLLGGQRGGGDVYFAVDVTDPKDPKVLWEYALLRNMVVYDNGSLKAPFWSKSAYDDVKMLPISFSQPYVGRLKLADPENTANGFAFKAWNPISPVDPDTSVKTGLSDNDFSDWKYAATPGNGKLSGWFAFLGSGVRLMDNENITEKLDNVTAAMKPYLLAIDLETGVNIFQYVWPQIHAQTEWSSYWDIAQSPDGTRDIPYSMGNPVALDVHNATGQRKQDGYVDRIYLGDLYGLLYGVKFNTDSSNTNTGMKVDFWKTKPIESAHVSDNNYRTGREPILVTPAAAFDEDYNFHVYFGTGKFENVTGETSGHDKSDNSTMAFYDLKDWESVYGAYNVTLPDLSGGVNLGSSTGSWPFYVDVEAKCGHISDASFSTTPCTWIKSDNVTADCCQSNCEDACWDCVLDFLTPGERVVDSAVVAGGIVFFTTFVPKVDPCESGGNAFLYALSAYCKPLKEDPFRRAGFDKATETVENKTEWNAGQYQPTAAGTAYVVKLGSSMPSRPVLDSSAGYVFVQTSDAKIHRIKVELPEQPSILEGWKLDTKESKEED